MGQLLLAHFFGLADADQLKQPKFGCLNQNSPAASFRKGLWPPSWALMSGRHRVPEIQVLFLARQQDRIP